MKEYTTKLNVDLPPEMVFASMVDPDYQQGRFMKVEVVEETPDGVGTTLRYFYQVLGMRLRGGTYTYSEYVPGRRFQWEFSGGPEMALTGGPVSATWTFEPADGGTEVTVRSAFRTRIPVVNHLARGVMIRLWRKELPRAVAEIEKRVKAQANA